MHANRLTFVSPAAIIKVTSWILISSTSKDILYFFLECNFVYTVCREKVPPVKILNLGFDQL